MRCKACNDIIEPSTIKWNKKMNDWEVCSACMGTVYETNSAFEVEVKPPMYKAKVIVNGTASK
jgi:hypothetical protein